MNYSKTIIFLLGLTLLFSCQKNEPIILPEPDPIFKVTGFDGESFVTTNGEKIFPWGFNYTNPDKIDLIEDSWDDEETWNTIEEDFQEMREFGANILRVHLQFNKYMTSPTRVNLSAFDNLKRLVLIAEQNGLYLIITGLAAYRKSDSPVWYDQLDDLQRWDSQKLFWKTVASTVNSSPAIFAYDLINEPTVANGCRTESDDCSWYPESGELGGFQFIQNISIDPDNKYWETIAEWSDLLTAEIRSEDDITMITIGLLPLGPINSISSHFDILSTHIYPKSNELATSTDYILNNQSDRPLLIEEFYNLNCSTEDLETFLDQIEGNYHGVIGHYFGKRLEEYSPLSISDNIHKDFLEFFIENKPD